MSSTSANETTSDRSTPSTMRAVVAAGYGGPEVLSIQEVETPSPAEDQVLIEVEASSLNALDWHMRTGTPYFLRLMEGLRTPKRTIDGADVAGTVVGLGPGVTEFSIGDAVFGETNGGGFGEYAVAKVKGLVPKPQNVSWEAAGATPVAGLTALQGLRTHAELQPGEHALINGAAGGVGTFAVQIAKALGAEVTAVCSTRNVEMARSLGADRVVDYTSEDVVDGGARFDVMFDGVGNRTPKECQSVLKPDARFVLISGPKSNPWIDPMAHIARSALSFRRASQSFHQFTASPNGEDLTFLGELLADRRLVPEIQRVVGLDGVADGLAEIGSGHARAKIVVVPRR
jgi:NADPH:quinone reductase-like Zn-dependent oxidoreductase